MALHFKVKRGRNLPTKDILAALVADSVEYGVPDEFDRLWPRGTGNPMIIYDPIMIGRGVQVGVKGKNVWFEVNTPASPMDIDLVFRLLEQTMDLCGKESFIAGDQIKTAKDFPAIRDSAMRAQKQMLAVLGKQLPDLDSFTVTGAIHPITFNQEDRQRYHLDDWDEFGAYLHEIQKREIHFGVPFTVGMGNFRLGLFNLVKDTPTSFPFDPGYLNPGKKSGIQEWAVVPFDPEHAQPLGMLRYDDFLAAVDTSDRLDSARFVVEFNEAELEALWTNHGKAFDMPMPKF